jgi:DNA-binding transcriptional ArsR family regulator
MSNHSAVEAALDALGDPMRRRILECLNTRALPVGELAAELPIGRPAVSKHLRVLENAGLVEHSARGTRNLYALAPDGLREVQSWLIGLWDTSLNSFAQFVANPDPAMTDGTGTETTAPESRTEQ